MICWEGLCDGGDAFCLNDGCWAGFQAHRSEHQAAALAEGSGPSLCVFNVQQPHSVCSTSCATALGSFLKRRQPPLNRLARHQIISDYYRTLPSSLCLDHS